MSCYETRNSSFETTTYRAFKWVAATIHNKTLEFRNSIAVRGVRVLNGEETVLSGCRKRRLWFCSSEWGKTAALSHGAEL